MEKIIEKMKKDIVKSDVFIRKNKLTLAEYLEVWECLSELLQFKHTEFIMDNVKHTFTEYGIIPKTKGIGWEITI